MITRDLTDRLIEATKGFPAVTLTGPRQSGKSTLCRAVFPELAYVNLEAPDVRSFATEDPRAFLARYPDGAVIDEVQRCPELPSYLQGIINEDPRPGRWILTGSQNLALLESVSQSLAGRVAVLHLLPLSHPEVCRFKKHPAVLNAVLSAGGYPRIFDQRLTPSEWLGSYIATYVERDNPGAATRHLGHSSPNMAKYYVNPQIASENRPLPPSFDDVDQGADDEPEEEKGGAA